MAPRNQNELTEAERIENIEAQFGAEEDGHVGAGDTELLDQGAGDDPLGGGTERREPIKNSPADDIRSQIANRFRRPVAEERPFNGDMTDPENTYGTFGAEPSDDELDAEAAAREAEGEDLSDIDDQRTQRQPANEPAKREVTVRGKKMLLTEDEILAAAQKTLAGDSYLEDAKGILAQAKEIRAARTGATRQHPDGEMGAQDDLDSAADGSAQHPEPLPVDLVQKLQFGDPEEAAKELADYIDRRTEKQAGKAVEASGVERAFNQDLARSQKALAAFTGANPDLANDEIAAMAIEKGMYDLYREDMIKIGLAEEQLPKTPAEIANWHRLYRINGYEVRDTKTLLEASKDKFVQWRGGKAAPKQEQRPQKQAPRISVSVDRDARRQAIPLQPSRAAAPRRDVNPAAPADRSGVVANMRKQRGQV
jgi:hypothetical protein